MEQVNFEVVVVNDDDDDDDDDDGGGGGGESSWFVLGLGGLTYPKEHVSLWKHLWNIQMDQ